MALTREQVEKIVTDVIISDYDMAYDPEHGEYTFDDVNPDDIRTLMIEAIKAVVEVEEPKARYFSAADVPPKSTPI